jgi:multicomponent Na+:H+ antiporter subunit C
MSDLLGSFNYAVIIVLMMLGLYIVFAARNLIKRLVGLSVFQTSVFLFYISLSKVTGGQPPILVDSHDAEKSDHAAASVVQVVSAGDDAAKHSLHHASEVLYSNPLPHVLILTAIVVGVATLAIGLALTVRIREVYGSIEEDEIDRIDYQYNLEGASE